MIMQKIKNIFKKISGIIKGNLVFSIIIAVIIVAIAGVSVYSFYSKGGLNFVWTKNLTAQAAGQKVVDYINNDILKDQGSVSLKETNTESGLYRVKFIFEGQESEAYVTKDGKYLFPITPSCAINIEEKPSGNSDNSGSKVTSCDNVKKSDSPLLEAFVVSSCPYGLQMQRVLADVVKNVDLKNNIKVLYIGSVDSGKITSMHGDAEAQENLRQICLREETNKYWNYVSCYMKKGDSAGCLTSVGVDKSGLSACMTDSSRGLKYAEEDFALADQYGVQGSPTLIIAGDTIDESSFGGRTTDSLKSVVCCAFNNKPDFCSQELSKDSAATGLSETYKSSSSGSSDQGAGCATP